MIHSRTSHPHKQRHLRVATYNIHKGRGMDGRIRPERIVEVLREIDADVIALQEVVCRDGRRVHDHQARYVAEELGFNAEMGENRRYRGGAYGNVVLSRLPIRYVGNHDLSVRGRERRGCMHAQVQLDNGSWLHLFNIHLGTAVYERRIQAREIFRRQLFTDPQLRGNRIILGDFNEWKTGLASHLLNSHFENAYSRWQTTRAHTFPGILPMLALDYIYFDRGLQLHDVTIHRSRMALVASDHLPLVADFRVPAAANDDEAQALGFCPPAVASPSCHSHAAL